MAKIVKPKIQDESTNEKKIPKKETSKKKEVVETKETPQDIIVLRALNNNYPMWTNGLVLETDLLNAIHPVTLRDVLDTLVSNKTVAFDRGNFAYQITESGKNLLDSVLEN
jgi:hypothetical protein